MAAKIADKVTIIMIIHHVWVYSEHTNFRVQNNLFVLRIFLKTWLTITQLMLKIQNRRQ